MGSVKTKVSESPVAVWQASPGDSGRIDFLGVMIMPVWRVTLGTRIIEHRGNGKCSPTIADNPRDELVVRIADRSYLIREATMVRAIDLGAEYQVTIAHDAPVEVKEQYVRLVRRGTNDDAC